jgi:orotidine-5'-phosphate decarboxylase
MSRLQDACRKNGPLCIGLDTDPSYLPESVIANYPSKEDAVFAYNKGIVDAASQYAGCYKVQIAYYEAMGLKGMEVFAKTVQYIRSKNIPVISDIKRGDIADTASAYAKAHFAGDFETDIITVNPYMGFDTLQSFTEYCKKTGTSDLAKEKAIFVLLRTSNPGMQDIENQILQDGSHVLDRVGNHLIELQKEFAQNYGYDENSVCSPVGAVVGCTEEQDAINLRNQYPNIFFLIPGYGAQGGKAKIAGTLLGKAGGTVNSSRGVLCAWKKDEALTEKRESGILTLDDIVGAAEKVALASKTELLEMAGKYSV